MSSNAADEFEPSCSIDEALAAVELLNARTAETAAAVAAAPNEFEAYWAESASASVMRDYRAGRVVTIPARKPRRG